MVGRVEVANLVLKISSLWRSSPCRGQAFGTPRCAAGFKRSKCFKKGGSPKKSKTVTSAYRFLVPSGPKGMSRHAAWTDKSEHYCCDPQQPRFNSRKLHHDRQMMRRSCSVPICFHSMPRTFYQPRKQSREESADVSVQ